MSKVMYVIDSGEPSHVRQYLQHIHSLRHCEILPDETFRSHIEKFRDSLPEHEKEAATSFIAAQTEEVLAMNIFEAYEINVEDYFNGKVYHNIDLFDKKED